MTSRSSTLWAERLRHFAVRQCPLAITTNARPKGLSRASILPLFLAMMIAGLSSSLSFADDGLILPDSARISLSRAVSNDTVLLTINNLSPDSVKNFFLSDFTDSQVVAIECVIDNIPVSDPRIEKELGSVYVGKYSTRWVLGGFQSSVRLKYYSPNYSSNEISLSAGHPYAIMGMITVNLGIGPPREVHWGQ
jgi:hypothetical protein